MMITKETHNERIYTPKHTCEERYLVELKIKSIDEKRRNLLSAHGNHIARVHIERELYVLPPGKKRDDREIYGRERGGGKPYSKLINYMSIT